MPIPNNIKGKDLFDSMLWKDPVSTSVFYTFIASLRTKIRDDIKKPTPTHRFIRTLRDTRKLVRCYTQNIDGLESEADLCTDLTRGKGNRSRFSRKSIEKPKAAARFLPGGDLDGGCEVIQLHGDLKVLRCMLCQQTSKWEENGNHAILLNGKAPQCRLCVAADRRRQDRGKRGTKIGTLRPNIVLYGEEHPSADAVGNITAHDLALAPDVLLILGTSLHVHGLKILVKEFAKSVHARAGGNGKVIFVNFSRPTESVWKDVIDYWVSMDCDAWVGAMKKHRSDIWPVQRELQLPATKSNRQQSSKSIPKGLSPPKTQEDKENAQLESVATPYSKTPRPNVLISPRKQTTPLQDNGSSFLNRVKKAASASNPVNEQTKADSPLQLPTPPSTRRRERFQTPTPSKKRSLALTYQDMFATPSKRRKSNVTVLEDSDTEL